MNYNDENKGNINIFDDDDIKDVKLEDKIKKQKDMLQNKILIPQEMSNCPTCHVFVLEILPKSYFFKVMVIDSKRHVEKNAIMRVQSHYF